MDILIQQIVSGLATGGIYASLALALVMIYQATDVVNFAQGSMAMFSTYIAWSLLQAGLPYWVTFCATLLIAFAGGLLIERVIVRPVENAPILAIVIVTLGLLVIFVSIAGWIYSYIQKPFPSPFPDKPLKVGNIVFGAHDLGAIGVTLVVLLLLFLFFRYTTLGLAMRAAAQNPVSSRLCGIRVSWMLGLGWGLAATFGAVAGLMGSLLASGFAALILKFLMEIHPRFDPVSSGVTILLTALLAAAAGWGASFPILGRKPLEILREE